ncbi:MAG: hypothetical protein GX594_04575, partial [Pirellulaceae bacterium]|nr:hypothetical protein [Pirellulaceae bacterium]
MKPIVSIPSLAVSLGIVAILIFLAIGATSRSTATTDVSEAVKEVSKPSDEVIATPPAPTARAAEVNRVYQPADDAVRQSVNLWNVGPAEFEGNLLRSLAGYITSRGDDNGSPEYLLHLNDDLGICLRIGMTNNQVLL